ncbi:hypothetical protein [Sphingomonas sp. PB1R3]|uniref:hypothetical protein n=1 Tax=Sphingomonas flavida TaxID=3096154 RepID=UPI002FC62A65
MAPLILAGCGERSVPLTAYRHPADAIASLVPLRFIRLYPCANHETINGIDVLAAIPTDECYKMLPPRRFRGIWLSEFEGSRFFEGETNANAVVAKLRAERRDRRFGDEEWLSWKTKPNSIQPLDSEQPRLMLLDFIGRRTAYRGEYGHMGASDSEIIVDSLIAAKAIN